MTIHAGKTVTNKLSVLNWSPGTAEEQQPYRSELVGINGTLSALKIIVDFYKIQHGTIEIACDNMEAKNQSEKDEPYISISQNCADIIQDIRNRKAAFPRGIKFKWRWVEGHQKEKGVKNIDWWGKQNDKVDTLAKYYLKQCEISKRTNVPIRLWYEKWAVYVDRVKLSTFDKTTMYTYLRKDRILKYWLEHSDFPVYRPEEIDWEPCRLATKRVKPGFKRFYAKFVSGWIGNNHKLNQYTGASDLCPICNESIEKSSHILRCQHYTAKEKFFESMKTHVGAAYTHQKTYPPMKTAMIKIISAWRHRRLNCIKFTDVPTKYGLRSAIKAQQRVGWTNFILGRWTPLWQKVQQQHLDNIKSKRSAKRWASAIIEKHLLTIWDIWQFRCTIVHGPGGVIERNLNEDIDQELIDQFRATCEDDLLKDDQKLLRDNTLAELQQKTMDEKRQWLRTLRNAITAKEIDDDDAEDDQQPESESGQTTILQFFVPIP